MRDATGQPVAGALLRLFVPVEFMGETKNEIVGEGTTNDAGRAVDPVRAVPDRPSREPWPSGGRRATRRRRPPCRSTCSRLAYVYAPEPVGLQAWWARSYLILVPFAVIWTIYLLLLWLVVRVRRAGAAASAPSDIAATS